MAWGIKKVKILDIRIFTFRKWLSCDAVTGYLSTDYLGYSSETVSLALPLARREASTLRPLAVDILRRNPCLFFRLRFEG